MAKIFLESLASLTNGWHFESAGWILPLWALTCKGSLQDFVVLIKLSKQPLSYLHKTPFNTEMTTWHFLICTNHMADSFVLQEPIPYGSVV